MIGSYYESRPVDPLRGLGNVSSQASLAHEAVSTLLMGTLGRFAPWGEQTVGGWQDYRTVTQNYDIYPMNAQTLEKAEALAFGNPVGLVGALLSTPVPLKVIDQAFTQGPYQVVRGEAIYRIDDMGEPPRAAFLYLGTLMDEGTHDGRGSYQAMEQALANLGARLVYVEPGARSGTERPLPTTPLEVAVPLELGEPVVTTTALPAAEPSEASSSEQKSNRGAELAVGAIGIALGAMLGYKVFQWAR